MDAITHLICAYCGADSSLKNYENDNTVEITTMIHGICVMFNCKFCEESYPLTKLTLYTCDYKQPAFEGFISKRKG